MNGTIGGYLQSCSVIRAVGLQVVLDWRSMKPSHILRAQDEFCKWLDLNFPLVRVHQV
jgi:hypothetical protein